MADDWQWFWAGEQGRDRILREELEGLQAQSAAAHARSSRLNSQLASLSGSIETRLAALSAAFDAYVELGDVREQLSGYPDTAAIRRDTAQAIDQLSRAGVAAPVDARKIDYWLPYATNAVIALAGDGVDLEAEGRALELDRDAELFIVAAAGALGHGAAVASRVPPLLVCDGTLTSHQVALWTAAYAGVYGAILPDIHVHWAGSLDHGDFGADSAASGDWLAWVRRASSAEDAEGALHWLDAQTSATAPVEPPTDDSGSGEPTTSPSDPTVLLRQVVGELVGRGMPGEAELLARSRDLRARIEDPGAGKEIEVDPKDRDGQSPAKTPATTVVRQVRDALLATVVGSESHSELLSWIGGPLAASIDPLVQEAQSVDPGGVSVRTPGGSVPVTVEGPLPVAITRARENIALRHRQSASKLYGSVLIAALFAVLVVVSLIFADSRGLPVVLGLSALAAVAVVVHTLQQRKNGAVQQAAELKELDQRVEEGRAAAQQGQRDRQQQAADLVALADTVRVRLSSTQTPRGVSGVPGVGSAAGAAGSPE